MSLPFTTLRIAPRVEATLPVWGTIGRLPQATLRLQDPRISEIHALLTLRGCELVLLAERGRLEVDGEEVDQVALAVGQQIVLGGVVALEVVGVSVPDAVLALSVPGRELRELCASMYSIVDLPSFEIIPEYVPEAVVRIWNSAEGWQFQLGHGEHRQLKPGTRWTVGGVDVMAVLVKVQQLSSLWTSGTNMQQAPLVISGEYDTVRIQREGRRTVVIDGIPARILLELHDMSGSCPWAILSQTLWPRENDRQRLRKKWDRNLGLLRMKLRANGVRDNLVRSARQKVELYLHPDDRWAESA